MDNFLWEQIKNIDIQTIPNNLLRQNDFNKLICLKIIADCFNIKGINYIGMSLGYGTNTDWGSDKKLNKPYLRSEMVISNKLIKEFNIGYKTKFMDNKKFFNKNGFSQYINCMVNYLNFLHEDNWGNLSDWCFSKSIKGNELNDNMLSSEEKNIINYLTLKTNGIYNKVDAKKHKI